jgi:hypothetical protein
MNTCIPSCLGCYPNFLQFGLALTCEALFLPVVPLVLVLVLIALVLPKMELGRHEECRRDHRSQLVEPELHPKLRVLPHPLLGS